MPDCRHAGIARLLARRLVRWGISLFLAFSLTASAQEGGRGPLRDRLSKYKISTRTEDTASIAREFMVNPPDPTAALSVLPGEDAVVLDDTILVDKTAVVRCLTVSVRTQAGVNWAAEWDMPAAAKRMIGRTITPDGQAHYVQPSDMEREGSSNTYHLRQVRPGVVVQIQTRWLHTAWSRRDFRPAAESAAYGIIGSQWEPSFLDAGDEATKPLPLLIGLEWAMPVVRSEVYVRDGLPLQVQVLGNRWTASREEAARLTRYRAENLSAAPRESLEPLVPGDGPWLVVGSALHRKEGLVHLDWQRFAELVQEGFRHSADDAERKLGKAPGTPAGTRAGLLSYRRDPALSFIEQVAALRKAGYCAWPALLRRAGPVDPQGLPAGTRWFEEWAAMVEFEDGTRGWFLPAQAARFCGELPGHYDGGVAWLPTRGAGEWVNLKADQPWNDEVTIEVDWTEFTAANPEVGVSVTLAGSQVVAVRNRWSGFPEVLSSVWRDRWRAIAGTSGFEGQGEPSIEDSGERLVTIRGTMRMDGAVPALDGRLLLRPLRFGELDVASGPGPRRTDAWLGAGARVEETHLFSGHPIFNCPAPHEGTWLSMQVTAGEADGRWRLSRRIELRTGTVPAAAWEAWRREAATMRAQSDRLVIVEVGGTRAAGGAHEAPVTKGPPSDARLHARLMLSHRLMDDSTQLQTWTERHGPAWDAMQHRTWSSVAGYIPPLARFDNVPAGGVWTLRAEFPAPRDLYTAWLQIQEFTFAGRDMPSVAWVGWSPRAKTDNEPAAWKYAGSFMRDVADPGDPALFVLAGVTPELDRPWCVELDFHVREPLVPQTVALQGHYLSYDEIRVDLLSASRGWRAGVDHADRLAGEALPVRWAIPEAGLYTFKPQPRRDRDTEAPVLFLDTPSVEWEGTTYNLRTWEGVARCYRAMLRKNAAIAPETGKSLEELFAEARDQIRYVAIPLGMRGIVPSPPEEVEQRAFGDCKEKTCWLLRRAAEEGRQMEGALVEAGEDPLPQPPFPSLHWFNHVVAAVPGADGVWSLWDATAPYLQPGELRPDLHGQAFLVLSDPPVWVTGPPPAKEGNSARTIIKVVPAGQSMRVDVQERIEGLYGRQVAYTLSEMPRSRLPELFEFTDRWFMSGATVASTPEWRIAPDGVIEISHSFQVDGEDAGPRLLGVPGGWIVNAATYGRATVDHAESVQIQVPQRYEVVPVIPGAKLGGCDAPSGFSCSEFHWDVSSRASGEPDEEEAADKKDASEEIRTPPDGWFLIRAREARP